MPPSPVRVAARQGRPWRAAQRSARFDPSQPRARLTRPRRPQTRAGGAKAAPKATSPIRVGAPSKASSKAAPRSTSPKSPQAAAALAEAQDLAERDAKAAAAAAAAAEAEADENAAANSEAPPPVLAAQPLPSEASAGDVAPPLPVPMPGTPPALSSEASAPLLPSRPPTAPEPEPDDAVEAQPDATPADALNVWEVQRLEAQAAAQAAAQDWDSTQREIAEARATAKEEARLAEEAAAATAMAEAAAAAEAEAAMEADVVASEEAAAAAEGEEGGEPAEETEADRMRRELSTPFRQEKVSALVSGVVASVVAQHNGFDPTEEEEETTEPEAEEAPPAADPAAEALAAKKAFLTALLAADNASANAEAAEEAWRQEQEEIAAAAAVAASAARAVAAATFGSSSRLNSLGARDADEGRYDAFLERSRSAKPPLSTAVLAQRSPSPARSASPSRASALLSQGSLGRSGRDFGAAEQYSDDEGGDATSSFRARSRSPMRRGDSFMGDEEEESPAWRAPAAPPPAPSAHSWRAPALHAGNADLSDLAAFVCRPAPPLAGLLHCHVTRAKPQGPGSSAAAAAYCMYLEGPNPERIAGYAVGARFLLFGARQRGRGGSHYVLSLRPPAAEGAQPRDVLAHLRSNFLGTEFVLAAGADGRDELAAVTYGVNLLGARGPRRMMGALPAPAPAPPPPKGALARGAKSDSCDPAVLLLRPKAPRWNARLNAFVLNFHGRVALPSVKNCQMLADGAPDGACSLQFGKVSEDTFTLDFMAPISPLQAFAIALSAFDQKLCCE
jgi:tubby-related protein 1